MANPTMDKGLEQISIHQDFFRQAITAGNAHVLLSHIVRQRGTHQPCILEHTAQRKGKRGQQQMEERVPRRGKLSLHQGIQHIEARDGVRRCHPGTQSPKRWDYLP